MLISPELLQKSTALFGLELTAGQIEKFDLFAKLLIDYNKKVNLTAITEPDDIVIKHFSDSLAILGFYDIPQNALAADVGTGAGFPGLALMIARPDLEMRLLDSTKKKLDFVDLVISELDLKGETLHMRAEEAGQDKKLRERFDFVSARAVAQLRILAELCLPLLRKGGVFASMKGSLQAEELVTGELALKKLGGEIFKQENYSLLSKDSRSLVFSKKLSQTATKYPRAFSQISKNPL